MGQFSVEICTQVGQFSMKLNSQCSRRRGLRLRSIGRSTRPGNTGQTGSRSPRISRRARWMCSNSMAGLSGPTRPSVNSLSEIPGKQPGKSALDELAENTVKLLRKAMEKVREIVAPKHESAAAAPSPSPTMAA